MSSDAVALDSTDAALLAALQADGRQSITQLARSVSMSPSAVTERVRRLEETGVITGYAALVDPRRLGYPVLAHLRLRCPAGPEPAAALALLREVVSAHHVAGDDGYLVTVVATSLPHLESLVARIGAWGAVSTDIAYGGTPHPRPLGPAH